MSDAELAQYCANSYHPGGATIEIGSDLAALIVENDLQTIVAFRGTANIKGWLRDFSAFPKSHHLIGYCHHGFLEGASALWTKLSLSADKPVILTGHSLGGALAIIVGALRIAAGDRLDSVVTFGAPRAGFAPMVATYGDLPVRQYRRGNDPVPEVPLDLIAFPYKHVRPLIQIGHDQTEPWRCHNIFGYAADLFVA